MFALYLPRNWIERRVKNGKISRESALLYLILPGGYVASLMIAMTFAHMFFALFLTQEVLKGECHAT